eukprot:SAG31_NODE_7275_length_1736_cov_4.816127_4_plen_73_part_00
MLTRPLSWQVAYNLFAITNNPAHKTLGDYFYKARFMDPLAHSVEYALTGQVRGYFLVFVPTIREIRDFYREM